MSLDIKVIINDTIDKVRELLPTVQKLDTAMTALEKTTSMSARELTDFYASANDMAKGLGLTTEEIIDQAAAWSRLGFHTSEAISEMTKYSAMLAAISPDMSLSSATDAIQSVMEAFQIGLNDTHAVLDEILSKINIIGRAGSVSNEDIVDFLISSSEAMAKANNTLEDTIALGTVITQITKDAGTAGELLNTISMNLSGYREDTGGLISNAKALSVTIADLTKTASTPDGIHLFSDEAYTQCKSTRQLLQEISEIYDQLSDSDRVALLEVIAGKNNMQTVADLLGNFDAVGFSLDSMAASAGNAQADMAAAMDTIEFKLNQLKETQTGILQNIFDREEVKAILDIILSLGNGLERLTGILGSFGSVGVGIGLLAGIKNVGGDQVDSLNHFCFE